MSPLLSLRSLAIACALLAPCILRGAANLQLDPSPLTATTILGGTAQVPLSIGNVGNAQLSYSFPDGEYGWQDSDHAGGPLYAWTDLSATGTAITGLGDESSAGPINIGFNFPFYGQSFGSFRVCSNGFLSFSATIPSLSYTNYPLPSPSAPANLIAFFWADLDFTSGGTAHYQLVDADTFVLQFKDVAYYDSDPSDRVSCQIILKSDGSITLQYLRVDLPANCTVGIQNGLQNNGLQLVSDATHLHAGMAVAISKDSGAPWLSLPWASRTGTVAASSSGQVNIPLNSAGLLPGTYTTNLALSSNDPAKPLVQIPVTLNVQVLLKQWKANLFTPEEMANAAISDDLSDPDGDGISNVLEFAMHSDPFVASREDLPPASLTAMGGQSYLTQTFVLPKSAPEFSWLPQVSGDLLNWYSGPAQTETLSLQDLGDGSESMTVRDRTALSASGKRFMRMQVSYQTTPGTPASSGSLLPNGPTELTATVVGSQIDLLWTDRSSNESGFVVERKVGASGPYTVLDTLPPNRTNYQDLGLTAGTDYFYRVRATNSEGGASAPTNEVTGTPGVSAPYAPYAYRPSVVSGTQINLTWYNYSTGTTSYRIERRRRDESTFSLLIDAAGNPSSYQDTGLQPGTQYLYRFAVRSASDISAYSAVVSATTLSPPPAPPSAPTAPSGLVATPFDSYQINLAWTDNSTNETGFSIERAMGSSGSFGVVGTVGAGVVTFRDGILNYGVLYTYRVRATNAGGFSAPAEASATTPVPPSTSGENFTVRRTVGAYFGNETIALIPVWQPNGTVRIRDTNTTTVPPGYLKIYVINEVSYVGELENYAAFQQYTNVTISKLIAQGTEFWRFINSGPNSNQYVRPELGGAAYVFTGRAP